MSSRNYASSRYTARRSGRGLRGTAPDDSEDGAPIDTTAPSQDFEPLGSGPSSRTTAPPRTLQETKCPRYSYVAELGVPLTTSKGPVKPKSMLLVSDLDNTLFGPNGDGVIARPYLRTFIRYIMHPSTPYSLAIWTFSGRMYGIAHLRQCGMGKHLFDSDDLKAPKFKPGLLAVWGYEDSGFLPHEYGRMASGKAVKDLDLMWSMLNATTGSDWSPLNSLLQDDLASNGRAQPDNIINCPVFTTKCPDDDFLLAQIGVLEELSTTSNVGAAIKLGNLEHGIPLDKLDKYVLRATEVCGKLGIKVSRGTAYPDPAVIKELKDSARPVGPAHDAAQEPAVPHPGALPFVHPSPKRTATGMVLSPSSLYKSEVAVPSTPGRIRKPLVIFDLDGTLYTRPPQHLEHIPEGEPSSRPYLRSFLMWLLRPGSPWMMAIWTGSQKATAVKCLYELDLGLVGPSLVKGEAELLHPKLVAFWAREDVGLTDKDFVSYVAIVKDLDKLWEHLADEHLGKFDPSNTVMVDDTPSKLRTQPSSLIAAPTYDYPLGPSTYTVAAQLDGFLLALADMLDELAPQSNFANFIERARWNKVLGRTAITDKRNAGLELLERAKIPVEAEARGLLPGTEPTSKRDQGGRTALSNTASSITRLTSSSLAALPRAKPSAVTSDTDNAAPSDDGFSTDTDTTDASVDGDSDDAEDEARRPARNSSSAARKSSGGGRR